MKIFLRLRTQIKPAQVMLTLRLSAYQLAKMCVRAVPGLPQFVKYGSVAQSQTRCPHQHLAHPPAPHMLHLVLREKLMVNCTQNQWKDTKVKWIILQDTRVDCNLVTVRVIACSCLVRTAPSVQFLQSYIVTRLVSFFDISLSLSRSMCL